MRAILDDARARLIAQIALAIRWLERRLGRPACRLCGCTEYAACPGGCFWADDARTLCSSCEWDIELASSRDPFPYPLTPVEPA